MEQVLSTFLRTFVAFILLLVVARFMGRKALAQMTFFDFVVGITLGSATANTAIGSNNTSLTSGIVVVSLGLLGIVTGFLTIKSFRIRKIVNSEPVVVIQNGQLIKDNLQKIRLTINELTTLLREKNTFNIADVEFAILENDGKLSVLPKSQKQPLTPSDLNISTPYKGLSKELIIDGNIMDENLQDAKLNREWLMNELRNKGFENVKEVFFAALDTSGNLYVSKGLRNREKEGQHGIE